MTAQPNWSVARSDLERVAEDLRRKGYDVLVEPSASEIPDFVRELLEAAMRIAAGAHSLSDKADSWKLMRELTSNGILDREPYQRLTELFRLRSALAHGMEPANVPAGVDLDVAVAFMCELAEQLLAETTTPSTESRA